MTEIIIIMKVSKQLKQDIQHNYGLLDDNEKKTLRVCTALCAKGVSLSTLRDIIGADSHVFNKEINSILKVGLLIETGYTVYSPEEIAIFLSDTPLPADCLNSIILKIQKGTSLKVDDDLVHKREYFFMGANIVDYILKHPYGIEWELFAKLIINLVRYYEFYAKPDPTIHNNSELKVIRAIRRCKKEINSKSLLYASLLTCEAYIHLCGFWYDQAKQLLDEAVAIETKYDDNASELGYTFFVTALYYENYGLSASCLEFLFKTKELTEDEMLGMYSGVLIAYELALVDEFGHSEYWMMESACISTSPKFCIARYFDDLINALKWSGSCETLSKNHLIHAGELINEINSEAAIKSRMYYVKSQIYGKWGLLKDANDLYGEYAKILARHFATTDGALYILVSAEVNRLTSIGAMAAARFVVINKLDTMQLPHPGYALSVKLDVCFAYTDYYRAIGVPLANTYCELGKEFAEKTIPSEETLSFISRLFGGKVPDAISGKMTRWIWEYQNLQNLIADKNVSRAKIKMQIELLKERFPCHHRDLDVISASLLDSYAAIHTWHMIISSSEGMERYDAALQCARIATSQGLIWDGADFYNIVLSSDGYKNLNKYQRIDVLLEVAANYEQCDARQEAKLIWIQLEALAKGTSKLADVYQARGNYSYDHEQHTKALKYYDKCLAVVQPEEGLFDQRLSSVYAFKSSCFGALGNYQAAYDDAVKAKKFYPIEDFDSFNLDYNHGFFAICLKKYKEARDVLTRAKTLARTKNDKEAVDELLSILAMKIEKREAYLKQLLYNFDTQTDKD